MKRLESLSRQASIILVERRGEILDIQCPDRAIRLCLRPIKSVHDFASNVVPMGCGYMIRGWLCGMPTSGILIQQHEITAQGLIHFGHIHPAKVPDERRRVLIPIPPPPRRAFYGYIESFKPFKIWDEAARTTSIGAVPHKK